MRILVYAINYRPELTGPAKYTTEMCEWLARRGHDVTVVVPPPYYPQWRVAAPYRSYGYRTSVEVGVRVRRTPIWIPRRPSGLARVLHTLSFALSSFPVLISEALREPDLVFVTEPSFLNLPGAWLAARIGGACAWLHIQDYEIDLAYDLGQLRRGRKFAAAFERLIASRFDVVSSISEPMLRRASAKGIVRENAVLLPNWVDVQSICPLNGPNRFRARLGIPEDRIVALYSGSLGSKQGIEMIVQAAGRSELLPIQFIICGEGVASRSLRSTAEGLSNVSFLPLQPAADLNELLNLADIHLLPQRAGAEGSLFPSKLIGMLASGRPVVAMAAHGSEIAQTIRGCGIRVDLEDIETFCTAIERLSVRPAERIEMGQNARQRALDRFRQDLILNSLEAAFIDPGKPMGRAFAHSAGD